MTEEIQKQLIAELKDLDNLEFCKKAGNIKVSGTIPLINTETSEIFESYDVDIFFPRKYPFRYPTVRETSEKIMRGPDYHNHNGYLCFEVPPKEILICRNGISFTFFIDSVLTPHLALQYYKTYTGKYPFDEYDHYLDGHFQFYRELLNVSDNKTVLKIIGGLAHSFNRAKKKPCICGSGKNYENCHYEIAKDMFGLTKEEIRAEYNRLKVGK